MKPTVLVTGGSGFIGTWVIRDLLERRCRVVAYDLTDGGAKWRQVLGSAADEIIFVRGDILDAQALGRACDEYSVSHLIHLAAWLTPDCQTDPLRGCEINVLGTMRLFEAIRARPQQIKGFAYASSFAVCGQDQDDAAAQSTLATTAAREPGTFYGVFKLANEMIARQYWLHYGIASVGLRPSVVYGPGRETGLSAAPTFAARAVARNEAFAFPFSGATRLEFVQDTARAFVRSALEIESGSHATDLAGHLVTIEEIIAVLETIQPGTSPLFSISGPPLPYSTALNARTIEQLFPDWQPTSLQDGFRQTIEFYRQ